MKVVIFGNSGSGKSTMAKQLVSNHGIAHLDLDTIAWAPQSPPVRLPIEESEQKLIEFTSTHQNWVIEGCYSDLLALATPYVEEMIFLNLSITDCIENAKKRPWEPHKYKTKQEQDANLSMLLEWIRQYENRTDTFSKTAHLNLYDCFEGKKTMITENSH